MDIEQLAVNQISDLISRCPRLRCYITVNDKTPFTDGHIDLYRDPARVSKDEFLGRVSVQVKGRTPFPRNRARPSIPIPRKDLNGYLRDRGVLYFVVYVDQSTGDRAPYYVNLSPFKIEALLGKAKPTTQKISARLTPLPSTPHELESLLRFSLMTSREDASARASESAWANMDSITLHAPQPLDLSRPITLNRTELDFSIFVRTGDGMELPAAGVLFISPQEYVGAATDFAVRAGEFEYKNPIRRKVDDNSVALMLSEGLQITLRDPKVDKGGATISLQVQDNLGARLRDVGFFLSCMDLNGFEVDGTTAEFASIPQYDVDELRGHFRFLTQVAELFRCLGADPDLIDLQSVSSRQLDQLQVLHAALVHGKEVEQDLEKPGRVLQPVGDWVFELLCVPGGKTGRCKVLDLLGPDPKYQFSQQLGGAGSEFVRITPYEIIYASRLPRVLNLHLDNLVASFKDLSDYPEAASRAASQVLRLITAADELEVRRVEFLTAAHELNDWLMVEDVDSPTHMINQWQILARLGLLTDAHRREIRELRRRAGAGDIPTDPKDEQGSSEDWALLIEVSCAILLADEDEVTFLVSRVKLERRELLTKWPIWTLYERGADDLSSGARSPDQVWREKILKAVPEGERRSEQ
ncbi:hypothetical protein [Serinicoccus sp. CUA-874]|uniref:hypothetical protein n=1 Tax=Serinicoccus sp. CUA-874 TaxID=1517939 RepID=UPI00117B69E9|nr:hypothetical protein [Serinicoccus sp. CUA-874]